MSRFKLKESKKELTSYAGLALIGQCLEAVSVEAVLDGRVPVSQGMKSSDLAKSVVGLLSLGKSDFEAIEAFREDRFFKRALGINKVPGCVWLRQRLVDPAEAVLLRMDSAFDSAKLLFAAAGEKDRWAAQGRSFEYLTKWNPRKQAKAAWLAKAEEKVIERYRDHGTHEQFHSEIKTDLDLERLPSGKFETNDCLLRLGMFAYNCLRLIGQPGLLGDLAPLRHPAKRRRLRTVLQEVMYRAAQVIHKARQWWLDLGHASPVAKVFAYLQERLVVQPGFASG